MKIAVTGGTGRVGSAVIKLALSQGHSVVSIDRMAPAPEALNPDVPFIQADITDYEAFKKAMEGCDGLVHMAAIPSPNGHPNYVIHNNNVTGSYNALRAAVEVGIKRICQASSINAIGGAYSRAPQYDYFPVDEKHLTYAEDPYSLSKWICEIQAESIVRRYEDVVISSLRFHGVVPLGMKVTKRDEVKDSWAAKHLWGYTSSEASASACLLSLTADFKGAEAFYIVAPETMMTVPSLELAQQFYPNVPVTGDLSGGKSFFDSSKAERLLGWTHIEP
jgi:nucleoside-diphosphate-sugar epimerase